MGIPLATERGLQKAVLQYLTLLGIPATATDASLHFGRDGKPRRKVTYTGWPDVTGCLPGGRLLAIELKSAQGRLRPEQARTIDVLRSAGALAFVARSIDEVERALRAEGYLGQGVGT